MTENNTSSVGTLYASLFFRTADWSKGVGRATSGFKKINDDIQRTATASERLSGSFNRAGQGIGNSISAISGQVSRLSPLLATLGVSLGTQQIMAAADAYTDLNSRVAIVAGGAENATAVMARLADIAARTYSSIGQTTEGYLKNATVLNDLGLSAEQALNYTEALNNAMVVSGAKGEQAASVQEALAEALILGKLSGDQLNAVMTKGGVIAQLLAAELGTTVSGLKAMGEQGKITSDVIVGTLFKNFDDLRAQADEMPATFGDAAAQVGNAITIISGRFNEASGASSDFTGTIKDMTDAIIAFAYSTDFDNWVSRVLGWFVKLVDTIQVFDSAITTAGHVARDSFDLMYAAGAGSVDAIAAAFSALPGAMSDLMYQAANGVISAIEYMINSIISRINSAIAVARSAQAELLSGLATVSLGKLGSHTPQAMQYGPQRPAISEVDIGGNENPSAGGYNNLKSAPGNAFNARIEEASAEIAARTAERNIDQAFSDIGTLDPLGVFSTDTTSSPEIPTIIPMPSSEGGSGKKKGNGGGGKGAAAKATEAQKVTEKLNKEILELKETMGMTAEQEAIWTAQRDAGVLGNAKGMEAIATLVTTKQKLEDQKRVMEANADAAKSMGETFADAFSGILSGAEKASDALKNVLNLMANNLIKNAFATLGGASAQGATWQTWLFGSIGKNANGTSGWGGGLTWIGERGPELVDLNRGAKVYTNSQSMRMAGDMSGGGQTKVLLALSPDIEHRILEQSGSQTVQIVQANQKEFERHGFKNLQDKYNRDPKRKG